MARRIAFYAPMKPPDHAIASGDREIARLMAAALQAAGFEVEIASRFISYQKRPDEVRFHALQEEGLAAAERMIVDVRSGRRPAPDLWFTYHPYCKAPDRIGPHVARALSIPYVTAEACRTRQGSDADWQGGRLAVQEAIRLAEVNFCLKPSDEAYLRSILPDMKNIVPLTPFLDIDAIRASPSSIDATTHFDPSAPLIVAVGMMRPGAKILSYRLLAESLSGLTDKEWNLAVIGDGPERANVEAMFGLATGRVHFAGALPHADVLGWMKAADMLAWPGVGEAIGMVYLEAAACRLPVAACDVANVATVVSDGESGLLARRPESSAYRAVLGRLLADKDLRRRLGEGGLRRVKGDHGIGGAAATLRTALEPMLRRSSRPGGPTGTSVFHDLERELERWRDEGLAPRFWLRDDDAVRPTPALDRLLGLVRKYDAPLLLAVIPVDATEALAEAIGGEKLVTPAVHGYAHRRHTPDDMPAIELGGERPVEEILAELKAGRAMLHRLFGERLSGILVPPWNRLSREVAARLHEIGFSALSTNSWHEDGSALPQINTHIDIVDWANDWRGQTIEWAMGELLRRLEQARERGGAPLGILSHHLAHDEQAWTTLDALVRYLKERNFAFEKADALVEEELKQQAKRLPV